MSKACNFKETIYEQIARIGKGISCSKRLELIELLCQGERTVEALANEAGLTIANTSQHLQVLRSIRLVEAKKNGLYVTYRIANSAVLEFFLKLRAIAENQLAEIRQIKQDFLANNAALEVVERNVLIKRVKEGTALVIDVRPVEEYNAAHINGAISIPLKELKKRLSTLPKKQEIVAYCRGPYCVLAVQAVEILRKNGFRAAWLEDGVIEWQSHGLLISK